MSFNPFKAFETDLTAEEKGRVFDKELGFGPGVTCTIARAGNRAYSRLLSAMWKANEETLKRGQADDATEEERKAGDDLAFKLVGTALAKTVLLNWAGMTDRKGNPLPYSTEAAEELLAIKDFRAVITRIAESHRSFLVQQEDENAKNSVPTSSGNLTGAESTVQLT